MPAPSMTVAHVVTALQKLTQANLINVAVQVDLEGLRNVVPVQMLIYDGVPAAGQSTVVFQSGDVVSAASNPAVNT